MVIPIKDVVVVMDVVVVGNVVVVPVDRSMEVQERNVGNGRGALVFWECIVCSVSEFRVGDDAVCVVVLVMVVVCGCCAACIVSSIRSFVSCKAMARWTCSECNNRNPIWAPTSIQAISALFVVVVGRDDGDDDDGSTVVSIGLSISGA